MLKRTLAAIGVERGPATWLLLYGKQDDQFALNIMQIPEIESKSAAPAKPQKAPQSEGYDGSRSSARR